jgi:uncharacterized protein (TIGR03437 family)
MADTPTIQNGDFEMPRIGPPFVSSVMVPGWNHSGAIGLGYLMRVGYTDAFGTAFVAGHGQQFLLLGGGPINTGDENWSTDITGLTPGVTYTLSFLMGSQRPRIATTLTVSFQTGSVTQPQTFTLSPNDFAYWGTWEQMQMNFVATAPTATVVFSVFETKSELGLDYVNVAVAATPLLPPSISSVYLPISNGIRLAPGAPMLINGANLGTGANDVATITIAGESAPIISFLNSTSVLAQVPVDLQPGPAGVVATRAGMSSNLLSTTIVAYAPEIYYGSVSPFTDSAGNPITTSNLAVPGASVTCLAIGLGPTNPPQATGVPAAAASPAATPVEVTVDGRMVAPDFAGLAKGSLTDYTVTFKIPLETAIGAQPVSISVGGATSNTVTLQVGPALPQINAIVNAASFKAGTASPGSFVSIFGSSFGTEDTTSNIFPATSFNGVTVLVNSAKVPLSTVSASKGQINLVLPPDLAEFGTALVQVSNAVGVGTAFVLQLAPNSVGVFRINDPADSGRMNGAVLFSGTAWDVMPLSMAAALGLPSCSSVTTASACGQPAKAGDQVQIYLTGLGRATPNGDPNGQVLPTGVVAPADGSVLYKTVQTPTVKVGGIPAEVSFSGIAPGTAGEYQINIAIPSGVQPGDSVLLTVTMPDGNSDTVVIAITE